MFSLAGAATPDSVENFQWPLKFDKQFSSGFGDSRPGRFHMGVDLRTGGQEGLKVYAPEDGYVYRLKTTYNGYGKALYIKGVSGRIYVFGHLQTYNREIGVYLKERQISAERYYQDICPSPGDLPVRRGEYVARTGQTGAGAPHLHLEIRDTLDRPLNPLYFPADITDVLAPRFDAVWLTYFDSSSIFETGGREKKIVPLLSAPDEYTVTDTLVVTGRFGVKAAIADRTSRGSFELGPSRIRLFIDGVLFQEVNYDRISYDENIYSLLDKDYDPVKKKDYKRIYNLYRRPGNRLTNYSVTPGDGTFSDSVNGYHRAEIVAEDPFGNASRLTLTFYYFNGNRLLEPLNRATITDSMMLFPLRPKEERPSFDSVHIFCIEGDSLPEPVPVQVVLTDSELGVRGDFSSWPDYAVVFTSQGTRFPAYPVSTAVLNPNGEKAVDSLLFEVVEDGVLFTAFACNPGLNWLQAEIMSDAGSQREFFRPAGGGRFVLFYRPETGATRTTAMITRGPVGLRPDTLAFSLFHAQAGAASVYNLDSSLTLTFDTGDLFDEAIFFIGDTVMAPLATGYCVGRPFFLKPEICAFADLARLCRRLPDSADTGRIRLYIFDDEKGWEWIGGTVTDSFICSALDEAGILAYLADTVAPQVKELNIEENGRIKASYPEIRFMLEEELSGIEDDFNIRITIDGRWLSPEYDPEQKKVAARTHWRLTPGKHALRLEINDRCGNRTIVERSFRVRAGADVP